MPTPRPARPASWAVAESTLLTVFSGDAALELARLTALADDFADPADRAVLEASAAMAAVIACRFPEAAAHGAAAARFAEGGDVAVRRVAEAALLMVDAMSGASGAAELGVTLAGTAALLKEPGAGALLTRYLLAEAALSAGDVATASVLIRGAGLAPGQATAAGHPQDGPVDGAALTLQLLAARLAAFQGHPAEVHAIQDGLRALGPRVPARATTVLVAIGAYGAALAADRVRALALCDLVLAATRSDANYLSVGSCLYVAWALRALGQLQRAASLLVSTGGADLERCKVWDRAFATEVLVEAALDRDDPYRAGVLVRGLQALAAYPVAASAVARAHGALAAALGDSVDAEALALASMRIDAAVGALSEVQRGRLVQAAALTPRDPVAAAAILSTVAREADRFGNEALRRTAAMRWNELASQHPAVRGDVAVLTARQREIAVLIAEGHSNDEIARVLFLSPRTVQSHVAEILRRTGRRTRSEVAADVSGHVDPAALDALSARQRQIAVLIAQGRRNTEIAAALGLRPKTVENHVAAILRRLGVRSRAAVAAMAGFTSPGDPAVVPSEPHSP